MFPTGAGSQRLLCEFKIRLGALRNHYIWRNTYTHGIQHKDKAEHCRPPLTAEPKTDGVSLYDWFHVANLREQMPSPAGLRLLLDLAAQRTRLFRRSPVHGSGRNHGPTPEGWSPRCLECPGRSVRCAKGRPATPSDWRTAERTADRLPSARSRESRRCQPTRPGQSPGLSTRHPAHRL